MTDKIIKLLSQKNFGDIYIGLKLFEGLPRIEQLRILKKHFSKGHKNAEFSWRMWKGISEVPVEYEGQYIVGKYYSYVIQKSQIMVDTPCIFKRFTNKKRDSFTILENWTL